jgi:hypothetical protein
MYENHKLCSELRPNELCIVLEQYHEGNSLNVSFTNMSRAHGCLPKAKSICCARWWSGSVRAFLNTNGKVPSKNVTLQIHTSYPEPGVLRHYCGGDTAAWADEVIAPASFRREKS